MSIFVIERRISCSGWRAARAGAPPASGAGGVCPSGGGAGERSRPVSGGTQCRAGVRHRLGP